MSEYALPHNDQIIEPAQAEGEPMVTWQPKDKSQLLRQVYGFDPHTTQERNEAVEHVVQRHPASHLNEVLLHQQKVASEDPQAALRYLVRQYGAYSKQAYAEAGFAAVVLTDIEDLHNFQSADRVLQADVPERQRAKTSPLYQIATDEFLEDDSSSCDPLLKVSHAEAFERSEETLNGMKVYELRGRLQRIVQAESMRQEFWLQQLEGAQRHMAVRGLARSVLENTCRIRK